MVQVSNIDDYRQQKATQPQRSPVERLLADARLRLVETGTRNRLVHTPRGGKRVRSLPVINADADALFQTLVRLNRAMRFLPADSKRELALEKLRSDVKRNPTFDPVPTVLRTLLDEEKLEKRLLAIYSGRKDSRGRARHQHPFSRDGILRWYEDEKSEVLREAPLVLVPVSLTSDRHSTFDLRSRDDDLTTNQAIQERLRTDFGIALPDLPENEEWLPSEYFAAVNETIATRSRWSIDTSGVELGFYSFSKLLMIRDLEPAAWGEKSIVDHPLLLGLLTEGFNEEPSPIPDNAQLDKLFAPADLVQVVDADSSQTIVIETVRKGRNLVVQGPPGTGKSQTIANIIAAAVYDGKSVLFVAEKMAALNVVHTRLQKVGLGPICLQLHSRGAKPVSSSLVCGQAKRVYDSARAPESRPPAYKLAEGVPVPLNIEPHEVTVADMARVTRAIVEIEGPIHQDEIARRVTSLFGKSRTGSQISAAAIRGLKALKTSSIVEQDGFWMTPTQLDSPPVRDRSASTQTLQRADMLSPLEIRAAAKIAERENGRLSEDEIAIAVTRLLGFKRTGPELRVAILKAIER